MARAMVRHVKAMARATMLQWYKVVRLRLTSVYMISVTHNGCGRPEAQLQITIRFLSDVLAIV